jgi:hypothetical protein
VHAAAPRLTEGIEILPVTSTADQRRFLEFPYELYRDNPYWVAPLRIDQKELLDTARHPFWKHADLQRFLALRDGEVCGRIAAIVDHRANQEGGEPTGTFGFYESIDSQPAALALIGAARDWLAARGMTRMRGPANPSVNYEYGLLVEGFEAPPSVMMTYNPPSYARLFESAGLRKARDLFSYTLTGDAVQKDRLDRALRVNPLGDIRIRPMRPKQLEDEIRSVWDIYTRAWERNWGSAPATLEEMQFLGKQLKPFLVEELGLFAEVAGQAIGFGLMVPDVNEALIHAHGALFPTGLLKILYYKSKIKKLKVIALGVVPEYQNSPAAPGLYTTLVKNALALGWNEAECSWILEDNRSMNRSLEFMGARRVKTYRVYESPIAK